ncbi:unnamed protein product [Parnassius apollo]|uniref:(apollo) hypothetical protein n=1 Tax=Parnassius apollo TaxID=110799 RepID=A0A8S3Y781_PARAO|nr:unnamed protein product [Parnassius apollo]
MLEKRRHTLMSIPEKNESDGDAVYKWVPKKKHEVLKAKYKCLKKLFQIYDASVIGILPDPYAVPENIVRDERKHSRRRRSRRTKTDASAGTNEVSSGDVPPPSINEKRSIATAVIRDLKLQYTTSVTETNTKSVTKLHDKFTQESKENFSMTTSEKECECTQTADLPKMPYLMAKQRQPKPTRFQMFLQRILGIRRETPNYVPVTQSHVYAASDNNIQNRYEKRRRHGLRFRRVRSGKKVRSETTLKNGQSPMILTYVQSVQRNCLMDTTPRQCPFVGCRMIFYGIINYNDHLNLCHFTDRKFICHYCHEGFLSKDDKLLHENEHIGIPKLKTELTLTPSTDRQSSKVASLTQTDPEPKLDVSEDKLKKIVSFFDKIDDPLEIISEINKSRHSASNLNITRQSSKTNTTISEVRKEKGNSSCMHLQTAERKSISYADFDVQSNHSQTSSFKCEICGENFDRRHRLNLHVDVEHRGRNKNSKFQGRDQDEISEDDDLRSQCSSNSNDHSFATVHTVNTSSTLSQSTSGDKSAGSESCDPTTNIVYYSSLEAFKKPSAMDSLVKRVRTGFRSYKWEPGSRAVHS